MPKSGNAENVFIMQSLIGMSCIFSVQQNLQAKSYIIKPSSCLLIIVVNSRAQLEPSVKSV